MKGDIEERQVRVVAREATLLGDLRVPSEASGIVLFAHGSGSSRRSSRNRYVAQVLNDGGFATLLLDLLTLSEEEEDLQTRALRFDIGLLAERLVGATDWLATQRETRDLPLGYFGASTGAGAALVAAAARPDAVGAVVSRGGRPDLAGDSLRLVKAPTLLIVGGNDYLVIEMNEDAMSYMQAEKRLVIVPGASHLFEEPGTLEQAAEHARDFYTRHLAHAVRAGEGSVPRNSGH
jgi:putative phosphoribosyl transferase